MAKLFDGEEFGKQIVEAVKTYLDEKLATVSASISALEKRFEDLPTPRDGKDADMDEVRGLVTSLLEETKNATAELISGIEIPQLPELPDFDALIADAVKAAMPEPVILPDFEALASAAVEKHLVSVREEMAIGVKDAINDSFSQVQAHADEVIRIKSEELIRTKFEEVSAVLHEGVKEVLDNTIQEELVKMVDAKDEVIDRKVASYVQSKTDGLVDLASEMIKEAIAGIDLSPLVDESVKKAVAEIPAPKDGKDAEPYRPTDEDIKNLFGPLLEGMVDNLPRPVDGKSVTVEDVIPLLEQLVSEKIALIPVPKDGKDGADGIGLAGMLIDRDGELNATLSNGQIVKLGPVQGKPGRDGADGKDGFSLTDFDAELLEDGKTMRLSFGQGETRVERNFVLPIAVYKGVYQAGDAYQKGDVVTYGGCAWHCKADTNGRPAEGDSAWQLMVKKGRDGRDLQPKEPKAIPNSLRVGKTPDGE